MKYIFYNIAVVFSLLLFLSSCITRKDKLYLQEEGRNKAYKSVPFKQYRLSVNDEINYYLLSTSQETQSLFNSMIPYRIYEDGCVVLPSIGRVRIAGLTTGEAEKVITNRFKSIVLDAEVKIALANNYFYIQGEGGNGQFYLYKEDLNVFQALAMAGDITSIGDKKHIKIIRKGSDGIDHIETFDLRKESIIGSEYYYIKPNDVIYIPTNPDSFFRIESITSFFSLIVAPLSLVMMAVTLFK